MQIDKQIFKKQLTENVKILSRKKITQASPKKIYEALVFTIRDYVTDKWIATHDKYDETGCKIVYYLSMEFLMGRFLGNAILNMQLMTTVKDVLEELNIDYNLLEDSERDPGLGNGGLGRLAACFLDSLSTLELPAYGCGIRYHYGIFEQKIENGYQVEYPDNWLQDGDLWGIRRPENSVEVKFGGNVKAIPQDDGNVKFVQENYQSILAVSYDYPVVGYDNNTVNTLRLWDAEAKNKFDLRAYNAGDYQRANAEETLAKVLTVVLSPAAAQMDGKV
ncbi:MAG: glycogen/starch/alpha-glucan phosphorylase, partial [Eubacterium sp.]|nr:glycogen/starch/alpha-glucan phosphorylase [Eubacterium sp.]